VAIVKAAGRGAYALALYPAKRRKRKGLVAYRLAWSAGIEGETRSGEHWGKLDVHVEFRLAIQATRITG